MYSVEDPECDSSLDAARRLSAFRRAAMDLAPSMLLSDSKNVLLWLTMEQGLDVRPSKKALMTPDTSR